MPASQPATKRATDRARIRAHIRGFVPHRAQDGARAKSERAAPSLIIPLWYGLDNFYYSKLKNYPPDPYPTDRKASSYA